MNLAELQNEIHSLKHDLAALNEVIVRLQDRKSTAERLLQALLDKGVSAAQSADRVALTALLAQSFE